MELLLTTLKNEEIIVKDVVTYNLYADGIRIAVPKEKEITFDHKVKETGVYNKVIVPSSIHYCKILRTNEEVYYGQNVSI